MVGSKHHNSPSYLIESRISFDHPSDYHIFKKNSVALKLRSISNIRAESERMIIYDDTKSMKR